MIMILFFAYLLVPYEDDDGEEDNEAEFSRSRFVAILFVWLVVVATAEVDACLFSTVGVVIDDDVVVLFAAVDTIDIYLSIVLFFIVEYLYLQFTLIEKLMMLNAAYEDFLSSLSSSSPSFLSLLFYFDLSSMTMMQFHSGWFTLIIGFKCLLMLLFISSY